MSDKQEIVLDEEWKALLTEKVAETQIPQEISDLPSPSNLKMAQDTDGLSPVMMLMVIRKKILVYTEISSLKKGEKEKFAGRMMRSIGDQTADGVAPELQQEWRFLVRTKAQGAENMVFKVDVHKYLDLKAGHINGRRIPLQDEDVTVMRAAGACCYFVILDNLKKAAVPDRMKTIVRMNFGKMGPTTRACLVIGVSMWARNSKVKIEGTTKEDQYIATFVVAITSGLMEPLTALSKLIKRGLLTVSMIDAVYPDGEEFPTIRAGSDAFAICKAFVMSCANSDLKAKFKTQEEEWTKDGSMENFKRIQSEDQ